MKKVLVLCVWMCGLMPLVWAGGPKQRLSKEEFRARQQEFITQKVQLTEEEATKFFPLYYELQDRKKEINDNARKILRERKDRRTELTEEQCEQLLEARYEARLKIANLEKEYFEKFKEIISCQKIFRIQREELRFHRHMLRGVRDRGSEAGQRPPHHRAPGDAPRQDKPRHWDDQADGLD